MPPDESSLAVDTETSGSSDTSETFDEQDDSSTETTEYPDNGQASEESFTSIDPSAMTPNELAHYKSMQADYTRKRQTEAREVAQYKQTLAQHQEYIHQYQEYERRVNAYLQQLQQQQSQPAPVAEQAPDYSTMTPDEILRYSAQTEVKAALAPILEVLQATQGRLTQTEQKLMYGEVKQAYQVQAQEAFSQFGEDNIREKSSDILEAIQRNPQLTVSDAYKILSYPQARSEGARTVQDALDAKRRASSIEKPNSRVPPVPRLQSTGDPFADAVQAAKAEMARR